MTIGKQASQRGEHGKGVFTGQRYRRGAGHHFLERYGPPRGNRLNGGRLNGGRLNRGLLVRDPPVRDPPVRDRHDPE